MAVNLTASSTDRVDYGDISAIAGLTAISIALTVKFSAAPSSGPRFFHQWGAADADQAFLMQVLDTNELGFIIRGAAGLDERFGMKTTGLNMTDGSLNRVVATWTAGTPNVIAIWVNGASEALTSFVGVVDQTSIEDSVETVKIGHNTNTSVDPAPGDYSEFAIWGRVVPDWFAKAYGEGFSPNFYRTDGILYDRLLGTNSFNEWANDEPTHTGTVVAAHPRVVLPIGSMVIAAAAAAAPGVPGGAYYQYYVRNVAAA